MTPEEKAKELIEKFGSEIRTSDFHIPEFISGVPCADGSDAYGEVLETETVDLAKQCAIICAAQILTNNFWVDCDSQNNYRQYWQDVLSIIKNK